MRKDASAAVQGYYRLPYIAGYAGTYMTGNKKAFIGHIIIGLMIFAAGNSLADAGPERIISLGPFLTEELYMLGAQDSLIGCTTYCRVPAGESEIEKVGAVVEVNLEKIVSLKPDLVLATSLTDHRAVKKMGSLGIDVAVFPMAKDFTELCEQVLQLGRLVGKEKEAQEAVSETKEKVAAIIRELGNAPPRRVFVQIGTKPLFAASRDSFINSIVEFAGGTNIVSGSKSGIYSREKVIKEDPDVIIIATMGLVGKSEKSTWEEYKTLKAVKEASIYIVDPYKFCSATPDNFVSALEETVKMLYTRDE